MSPCLVWVCLKRKCGSWAPGASGSVHRTREVHSPSLQSATCLQDRNSLGPKSVEEPGRSGEREGLPEALEQGPIPNPFTSPPGDGYKMTEAVTGATVEEGPWALWFVGLPKEAEPRARPPRP